jgi:hypothetical protein
MKDKTVKGAEGQQCVPSEPAGALKPCPFCGSTNLFAGLETWRVKPYVDCNGCHRRFAPFLNAAEWNTRAAFFSPSLGLTTRACYTNTSAPAQPIEPAAALRDSASSLGGSGEGR